MAACHVVYEYVVENAAGYGVRRVLRSERLTLTPDDGQKKCPKHVELYSKNKFEKLMHLVGFIIRTKI